MTSATIHRIDVSDLRTFRLTCKSCKVTTVAEAHTWRPSGEGATVCPHCGASWGDDGRNLIALLDALDTINARWRACRGPATSGTPVPREYVTVQVEITEPI